MKGSNSTNKICQKTCLKNAPNKYEAQFRKPNTTNTVLYIKSFHIMNHRHFYYEKVFDSIAHHEAINFKIF